MRHAENLLRRAEHEGSTRQTGSIADLVVRAQDNEYLCIGELELQRLLEAPPWGDVLLLDFRSSEAFTQGHREHAISVPFLELPTRVNALPPDMDARLTVICIGASDMIADAEAWFLRRAYYWLVVSRHSESSGTAH